MSDTPRFDGLMESVRVRRIDGKPLPVHHREWLEGQLRNAPDDLKLRVEIDLMWAEANMRCWLVRGQPLSDFLAIQGYANG